MPLTFPISDDYYKKAYAEDRRKGRYMGTSKPKYETTGWAM